jgi:hypothetical protein
MKLQDRERKSLPWSAQEIKQRQLGDLADPVCVATELVMHIIDS